MFRSAALLTVAVLVISPSQVPAGLAGNALQFDGIDDVAIVRDHDTLDITGQLTIETWVKLFSRDLALNQWAVGKGGAYGIYCETNTHGGTGNWKGYTYLPKHTDLYETTNLAVDTWYHLALTYDGTRMRVFVNGVQEDEAEHTGAINTSNEDLNFGQELKWSQYGLHGVLDEVRFWDIARTPSEISANYNVIVDPSTPGLVGYWNFDEPDGQDIYDLTASRNHGILGSRRVVETDDPSRITSDAPIITRPLRLISLASGDWNSETTWDDGTQIPTGEHEVFVGRQTVAITDNAVARNLEINGPGGAITVGPGVALDLAEDLTTAADSHLEIGISGSSTGQITAGGNVSLSGSLHLAIDATDPFKAGVYTLITAGHIDRTFGLTSGLGRYVSIGDNLDGLTYTNTTLTVTIDEDLNLGDANLSGRTDLTDFNIWNANKFIADTVWTTGDFNGDGVTDLSDFNIWNAHKFTVAHGGAAPAPTQVPEPGTMALLILAMAAWFACRRWRR